MAQKHRSIVVVDMDTYQIIPDVSVKVDNRMVVFTDKQGRVDIGEPFDSVMFSHVLYGREKLLAKEVTDTMYLLPNEHLLPEVVVSELDPRVAAMIKGWVSGAVGEGAMLAPKGVASFDFSSLLDKRRRRDKKHLKRARKILEEWDEKRTPATETNK
jgi:hypothetical protein